MAPRIGTGIFTRSRSINPLPNLLLHTGATTMDRLHFDRADYSVVVKNRAPPPNCWRWEIYRAGRSSPVKQSSVYFHTMVAANRAGKEALKQLLDKLPVSRED
jgi:hypothetical protein